VRKAVIVVLACVMTVSSTTATAQRRNRSAPRRSTNAAKVAAAKSAVELKIGRERVAAQIKTLTRFLYLLGGIAKDIESADKTVSDLDPSSNAVGQNRASKAKIRESIRNVREGLDKLETDFRVNPALKNYYSYLTGVAIIGETAENQAAANRFNEAGRSLLRVVERLADALAAMR
jgi:methyl-accepting chemotaxis protein